MTPLDRRYSMARYLKRGMDASAIKAADAKVRETVETILAEVEARRDAAVRELSQKFDNWSPPAFKLTAPEIERAISRLRKRARDDLHVPPAQGRARRHKVRAGAGAQFREEAEGDAARSRGRDAARRRARSPPHPGQFDRLLRAGWTLSDGRLGAYVDRDRARGGRETHCRLRTAVQGRAAPRDRRRHALRPRRRHLRAPRRAGGAPPGA